MNIQEKYRGTNIIAGSWYAPEEWTRINAASDEELLEMIPYISTGASHQIADAKRSAVISVLEARSAKVMIAMTRRYTILTWVMTIATVIMGVIAVLQFNGYRELKQVVGALGKP